LQLAESGVVPSGTRSNLAFVDPHVDWGDVTEPERLALADAQTSGGLLLAVSAARADRLAEEFQGRGIDAARIGRTVAGVAGSITVRGRIGS
jgi:selenide,water dikinase